MTRAGRAAIEVIGDVSKFATQLKRDLDRAVKGVKVDTRPVGDQITDGIKAAVDKVGDVEIDTTVDGVGATLANLRAVRNAVDEVGDEASRTGRKMRDATDTGAAGAGRLSKALGSVGVAVTSIGSALVGLGASAPTPAGIVAIGAALAGLVSAIPVVIALGAALADLAGLLPTLPAAAAVAGAAFGTLQIALLGVSDAIEAVLDGDPDKIKEALKRLAPAARSVVREFQELLPTLRGVQRAIQQEFFEPLRGALTDLAASALPTVKAGMAGIAAELGELGREILNQLGSAQTLDFLREVFDTTRATIDRVTESVDSVFNIITRLGSAGLPLIQRFVDWLLDGVDALSTFLSTAEGQSALQNWLDDAVATLKELWDLGKSIGNLLGAIFGNADDEGRSFIASLTDATNQLAEFFRSAEGQESLQSLLDLLPVVASVLGLVTTAITTQAQVINAVTSFWGFMLDFYQSLPDKVSTAATAVGGWFVDAWNTATAAVGAFISSAGEFLSSLPGRIAGWLAAAGAALVGALRAAFDQALFQVGVGIGLILFAVTQLPGMIWNGLQRLPGLVAGLFTAAWNTARNIAVAGFNAIVAAATSFVNRSIASLQSMPGRLRGIFTAALSAARTAVVSGFNAIVSYAASVPGRLAGLAGRFLSAGRNIIAGFMRGLSSAGSFAGNVGSAIVGAVRAGLNRVIGSINAGIAGIDRVLPGSLPRIPGLAVGGLTTDALLAQLHPNELVLPLESRRAVDLLSAALRRADAQNTPASPGIFQGGDVEVRVYVGDRELTDIVDVRIEEKNRDTRRKVLAGAGAR